MRETKKERERERNSEETKKEKERERVGQSLNTQLFETTFIVAFLLLVLKNYASKVESEKNTENKRLYIADLDKLNCVKLGYGGLISGSRHFFLLP